MTADLVAIKEQSEWKASEGAAIGDRRGKRHFRDCETACPAFRVHRELHDDAMLRDACGECTLSKGPSDMARLVMEIAAMPDAAIDYATMPAWMAQGIGLYRAMNRGL